MGFYVRISEVPEAEEIVIEIGERCGDLSSLKGAWNFVVGRREAFLKSIARRAKYEHLLWRVVAKDHVGFLPYRVVYDQISSVGGGMPYRILSTKPEGEVQITPKTSVLVKLWNCNHPDCPNYRECHELSIYK